MVECILLVLFMCLVFRNGVYGIGYLFICIGFGMLKIVWVWNVNSDWVWSINILCYCGYVSLDYYVC